MAKKKPVTKDPEMDQKPSESKAPKKDPEMDQKSSAQNSDYANHPKFSKFIKEEG